MLSTDIELFINAPVTWLAVNLVMAGLGLPILLFAIRRAMLSIVFGLISALILTAWRMFILTGVAIDYDIRLPELLMTVAGQSSHLISVAGLPLLAATAFGWHQMTKPFIR